MDWQKATAELTKMLHPAHVKPAKQFGPKGDYIEGWHAIAEANRIFGFGGWSYTITTCDCVNHAPREIGKDKKPGFAVTYTAKVRVEIGGVIREDFGAGHGYDVDCGLAHESAVKEAITDALKRALRTFGNPFGLALYDKHRGNVGVDYDPAQDVAKITDAKTGKDLLAVIPAAHAEHPAIRAAIVESLRRIVKGAQQAQVLNLLAERFAPVWADVAVDAQARHIELTRAA